MRILVAGATGSIGIHVVNTAIAMGHQPVTLVRNRRKIKLLPRGTDIFYGDVSIPETLTDLPKDIDAIIFTLGSDGQGRIGARAIDYGGVRNILRIFMDTPVRIALMTTIGVTERLSSWNQRTEVHDWKRRSERLVRASGHIYTIVRPGWFDYNNDDEHRIVMLQGDRRHAGTPEDGVISREQIAQVLVTALSNDAAKNKTFELVAEHQMQTTRTPYSVSFMATVLLLLLFACHSTIANAAVALGATRVIYPANQKQVLLPVTNNDPASVYLIQSWIENAGDQKDTQFVITPPLFSMQGKKENTLRIINATNHQLPGDRESLFWVNVKAIPAMEKDQKNENTLQLAIISRIKMFYRPTHLAMAPEEAPAMLRFRRSGSKLTLINPTPYFITVTNMKAGNSNLPNTMVPPKGEVSVDIPHAVTGDISFQTINDYGALTPRIKATMQ